MERYYYARFNSYGLRNTNCNHFFAFAKKADRDNFVTITDNAIRCFAKEALAQGRRDRVPVVSRYSFLLNKGIAFECVNAPELR